MCVRRLAFATALALGAWAHAGTAAPAATPGESPPAATTAAPPAATPAALPPGVRFVIGNDLWQPGTRYTAGADWLALACTRAGCDLEPARLAVLPEEWQGHYDDLPTAGERLKFAKAVRSPGTVVAWLQQDAAFPWLRPGSVPTFGSRVAPRKRPRSEGTLEWAVDLPYGEQASFVPLLDRTDGTFVLQLRIKGKRQRIGPLGACSNAVATDYFLWAGDLDRDGRPDYLVSLIDADGQALLLLGGAAAPDEIAGVGGVYDAPPYGGECDGGGWLAR